MADMRDMQNQQKREEFTRTAIGGLKVVGASAVGYGLIRNRHMIGAPIMKGLIKSKRFNIAGEIIGEAFDRGSVYSAALGSKPGFMSMLKAQRDPDEFERRMRLSFRAQQAARNQPNQLADTPLMPRRVVEHLSSKKSLQAEAIKRTRIDVNLKQLKADPTFAPHFETGLEELLLKSNLLGRSKLSEREVVDFVQKNVTKQAKEVQNHFINMDDMGAHERSDFVDKLFQTVDQNNQRIRYNQKNGQTSLNKNMSLDERRSVDASYQVMQKANFEALMRGLHKDQHSGFMQESMAKNGYHQLTLEDVMNDSGALKARYSPLQREGKTRKPFDFVEEIVNNAKHLGYDMNEVKQMVVDPAIFLNPKTLQIADLTNMRRSMDKGVDFVHQNFQVPFLNFNPIDLIQYGAQKASREAPLFRMFKRGDMSAFASKKLADGSNAYELMDENYMRRNNGAAMTPFKKDYIYAGGASYDLDALTQQLKSGRNIKDLNLKSGLIEDDLLLVSSEFGVPKRFAESIAGLTQHDGDIGFIRQVWGGKQENESLFGRLWRGITKNNNPDYGPNLIKNLKERPDEYLEETYNKMNSLVSRSTRGMSHDTGFFWGDELQKTMKKQYNVDIDFHQLRDNDEYILNTAQDLVTAMRRQGTGRLDIESEELVGGVQTQLTQIYKKYEADQALFLRQKTTIPEKALISSEMVNIASVGYDRMVGQTDELRKTIEQLGLMNFNRTSGQSVKDFMGDAYRQGKIGQSEIQETMDLVNLSHLQRFSKEIGHKDFTASSEALRDFRDYFGEGERHMDMLGTLKRKDPWYAAGPGDEVPDHYGKDVHFHMMKKHRGMLENINRQLAEDGSEGFVDKTVSIAQGGANYFGHLFAGRKNMEDVTAGTMVPWFFASRLDDAMAQVGLGLSNSLRGSATSIVMNQWGRRIVLPYVAYQQGMYLDGLLGDKVSDTAADGYVNMQMDTASVKEKLGINAIGRSWSRVFAGTDQMKEWIPSKLINFATGGALTDFRSPEELQQYYESGEDAIRKGRYWGIGSTTPWMGGKIERWQPNWYRRMKSDYQFSENGSGSESEYWANHWMPTLTHPFAPLRHFVFDSKHYENKLKDERPFAVTGGFAELDNIPLVGPLIDDTVGRILKPRSEDPRLKRSHREYLEAYNQRLASAYATANAGATVEMMPSGGVKRIDDTVSLDFKEKTEGEQDFYGGDQYASGQASGGYSPSGGRSGEGAGTAVAGGGGYGADVTRTQLTTENMGLMEATTPISRGISSLESTRDPNVLQNIDSAINRDNPFNLQYGTMRDVWYNTSEMAGIFGFAAKSGIGFEESGRGNTLQDSGLMGSYNKKFWDMELGGLGGDVSEITRRYLARDPNKNYYNPIRNTMPEWMPGAEYFTDFKHGDPYSRVNAGLMRLPGDAYEKLYNVRKDADGNYSALDRLRILADVAPYSDQYRMAKKQVSLLNGNGELTEKQNEEYATIREQVKEKKEKKHLYDRKFRDVDLQEEKVTVTKVLDANTFVTREYGERNPIKLAGVQVKNSDQETVDYVRQFIYEGATLKIGLDGDPLNRERKDLMTTMRAVVYTQHNEEGNPFYLTNKGSNLNFMLANRAESKDKVTIRDDGSQVATAALYSNDQITVGKMYDTVVRDILPKIPIAGVFADKFLQVRSPVESYERELYGKAWRDWASPWSGWIQPMIDTMANRNPIVAAAEGYGIGYMFGRNRAPGIIGMGLGLTVGLLATAKTVGEIGKDVIGDDSDWIPARRQKEREVDEYFDKLKYVKFKGLYEKTKELAKEREGVDLDALLENQDETGKQNKGLKKYIQEQKKRLSIQKKSGYGDIDALRAEMKDHNDTLKEINDTRPTQDLGPLGALALRYKQEYESTVYSADENINFQNIYKALPSKDREYFMKFMEASPKDREKILRLVPKYQRAIYQKSWGMKADSKESLQSYFGNHNLPGANWDGWNPGQSLDAVKVKVMKNEGIDLTEANYWDDDEKRAEETNIGAIPVKGHGGGVDVGRLTKVLKGAGLSNVQITMSKVEGKPGIKTQMDIQLDRTKEVWNEIQNNWQSLLS